MQFRIVCGSHGPQRIEMKKNNLPKGLCNPKPAVPYGHCQHNAAEGYPASAIANLQEAKKEKNSKGFFSFL